MFRSAVHDIGLFVGQYEVMSLSGTDSKVSEQELITFRLDFPCDSAYDPGHVFVNALKNCLEVSVTFYLACKREGLEKSLLLTARGLLLWFIAAGNSAPCSCSRTPGGMG